MDFIRVINTLLNALQLFALIALMRSLYKTRKISHPLKAMYTKEVTLGEPTKGSVKDLLKRKPVAHGDEELARMEREDEGTRRHIR